MGSLGFEPRSQAILSLLPKARSLTKLADDPLEKERHSCYLNISNRLLLKCVTKLNIN